MKVYVSILITVFVLTISFNAFPVETVRGKTPETPVSMNDEESIFLKHYKPYEVDIKPSAPQYRLPISTDMLEKHKDTFPETADKKTLQFFSENGFVVTVPSQRYTQFGGFYNLLKARQIPVFVTSDTVLHLYHILFDNILKDIEEGIIADDLMAITKTMVEHFDRMYMEDQRALRPVSIETSVWRRNVAFFSVPAKLLDDTFKVPDYVEQTVNNELALIAKHSGFAESPLFLYREDYSQYIPRGHYTHSDELKNYFKAMMWYGRMTFLLKGKTAKIRDAIVSDEVARMQTRQALAIVDAMTSNEEILKKWKRIQIVTAFFIGFADDLTIEQYAQALAKIEPKPGLYSDKMIDEMRKELSMFPSPAIYGGTGNIMLERPVKEEDIDRALDKTKGLRFFGQRFVPDSYVLGRLVGMGYTGEGEPFSKVGTPIGPVRGFPRGLDAMSVLGSDRARKMLKENGDTEYVNFDRTFEELRSELNELSTEEWHRNLYWGWLGALRTLLSPVPSGYPVFMSRDAWQDVWLETALSSWAQLRHDTILYAKQSYGMVGSAGPGPERKPRGYVEPAIELYAELRTLNGMMLDGLSEFDVLDRTWTNRLAYVNTLLDRLIEISKKELTNVDLTEAEMQFIENFGGILTGAIGELQPKSTTTAIIADVHTEPNTSTVVQVGTGALNMIWVACPAGDGGWFLAAGPVLSYHEFKQPMSKRLNDEEWQKIIEKSEEPETGLFRNNR